jgi:hypothetical protein
MKTVAPWIVSAAFAIVLAILVIACATVWTAFYNAGEPYTAYDRLTKQ